MFFRFFFPDKIMFFSSGPAPEVLTPDVLSYLLLSIYVLATINVLVIWSVPVYFDFFFQMTPLHLHGPRYLLKRQGGEWDIP